MTRLEAHANESETQVLGGDTSESGSITFVHQAEDFGSRHPVTLLFRFRTTEAGMEYIFQRRVTIVCLVATLHLLFFFLIQVITLAIQHLLLQLGIELLVFNRFVRNHIGHFHTKEASASRRITQNLTAVGGGYERSQARFGDVAQSLPTIHRNGHHLKQVLQIRLAFLADFVELIQMKKLV